ncbi:7TM diverse intracellular signaling domain-containing protein [Biformimicrobium ophioploci]|uniref:histidine kinase n=1 Tax=Biformimicrobium ophioploci TaxID=3036711 RepID=A0ABQ6LYC0_9GAMM|nr:7TM diverse intracellular signaling domain-containing protein [Microbulbifer sp. NKW57]GMG87053.1 hypothetical protein MNKW57_13740 [Microbulbifer sp. NKW57]
MRYRHALRACFLLVTLFVSLWASAASAQVTLPASAGSQLDLVQPLQVHNGREEPRNILEEADEHWQLVSQRLPNFGFRDQALWFRFSVRNGTEGEVREKLNIDNPPLDFIAIYRLENGELERIGKSGDMLSISQRSTPHRKHVFDIELEPGETASYFLRVVSEGPVNLPIALLTQDEFVTCDQEDLVLQALYIGIMVCMLIYNLVIYQFTREKSFLFYVLYVGSYLCFQVSLHGMGAQFLWPTQTEWNNLAIPLFTLLSCVFGPLFCYQFLQLDQHHRWLGKLLLGISAASLIGALLAPFISYSTGVIIGLAVGVTLPLLMMGAGILRWMNGFFPAKIFTIAWAAFMLGTLAINLAMMDILPLNSLTLNGAQFGSVLEVLLLSLALASRMRTQRNEHFQLQEQSLEKEREAHELKNEFLQRLQMEVDARTSQLKSTLETLELKNIELRASHRQALARSDSKSHFLARVSHELRTPLNGIFSYAQMLKQSSLDQIQNEQVNTIESSSRQLIGLIDDLLDISRFEAGQLVLDHRHFDLSRCLNYTLSQLAPTAYAKGLELALVLDPEIPQFINGDEARLSQLLTNLVGNGIKFTKRGGVRVECRIRNRTGDLCELELVVRDTGIGMTRSQQDALLEQLRQPADAQPELQGEGLGLLICKKLATAMGGNIELESTLHRGTAFSARVKAEAAGPPIIDNRASLSYRVGLLENSKLCDGELKNILLSIGFEVVELDPLLPDTRRPLDAVVIGLDCNGDNSNPDDTPAFGGARRLLLASTIDEQCLREISNRWRGPCLSRREKTQAIGDALVRLIEEAASARSCAVLAGKRIALIEDSPVVRKFLATTIEATGATVDATKNAVELAEFQPEVVLVGQQPDTPEAVACLESAVEAGASVIVMSNEDRPQQIRYGVEIFTTVSKPVTSADLLGALRDCIRQRASVLSGA